MVRIDRKIYKMLTHYGMIRDKKVKTVVGEILNNFIKNLPEKERKEMETAIKSYDFSEQ